MQRNKILKSKEEKKIATRANMSNNFSSETNNSVCFEYYTNTRIPLTFTYIKQKRRGTSRMCMKFIHKDKHWRRQFAVCEYTSCSVAYHLHTTYTNEYIRSVRCVCIKQHSVHGAVYYDRLIHDLVENSSLLGNYVNGVNYFKEKLKKFTWKCMLNPSTDE